MKVLEFLRNPKIFLNKASKNKKVIFHQLLQEFGHLIWLIHGLKSNKLHL